MMQTKSLMLFFWYTSADFDDLNPLEPEFTICPGPCVVVSSVISTLRYRNPNKSDVSLPFFPVILWKHCYGNVSISNDLIMLMPVMRFLIIFFSI